MPTIVVCAQNAMIHTGLASMVAGPTTQIVGKTNSLSALNHWLQTEAADLAVVDLSTIETDEMDELARIVEVPSLEENIPFLLMIDSGFAKEETLTQSLWTQLLSTGWVSILPITVSADEMKGAIAAITQGLVILHPEITESLFDSDALPFSPSDADIEPLTPRETEVLNQLASGLTNKAIALNLHISEHTVKFHISTLLSKLDVTSRTEAVTVGIRAGIVML